MMSVPGLGLNPRSRLLALAALSASWTLIGCGSGGSLAEYHAYGDSITAGFELSDSSFAYPNLLARDRTYNLARYAIPGDQACDVPTRQIFPHRDNPEPGKMLLYTLLIGTNDALVKGSGPYEAVFNLCQQASIAWLATPADRKVSVSAAAVTTSGPGTLHTDRGWTIWRTTEAGASITLPIALGATGSIYLWAHMVDGDLGSFSIALDGEIVRSFTTGTTPLIATENGSHDSLGFVRLGEVVAGSHRVTLTQTSTAGSMEIVAIGAPTALATSSQAVSPAPGSQPGTVAAFPTVVVGDTPRQRIGSTAPCNLNPARCDAFSADTRANVALLAGDGLDVRLADNHAFMLGTPEEMSDSIHPNRLGQRELRSAFEAVLDAPAP